MSLIPVTPSDPKIFGKITGVEYRDNEFGVLVDGVKKKVYVSVQPIDPNATTMRELPFKPSTVRKSKWMIFVMSFNTIRKEALKSGSDIKNESEMVNTYVCIEEVGKSGEIEGALKEWTVPTVIDYYTTEVDCINAWRESQPKVTEPEAVPWENPIPATPTVLPTNATPLTAKTIPGDVAKVLAEKWLESGKDPEKFFDVIKGWGYDQGAALAAALSVAK